MNFFGSSPFALASETRYSIIDVVVGFSFRSFEMLGNVNTSYPSHTIMAPMNIRNKILVQYHKVFIQPNYLLHVTNCKTGGVKLFGRSETAEKNAELKKPVHGCTGDRDVSMSFANDW